MKRVIVFGLCVLLTVVASADTGSGSAGSAAPAASGSAGSGSAGSGNPGSDCQPPDRVDPLDKRPVCPQAAGIMPKVPDEPAPPAGAASESRKACVAAMNADPTFAASIAATADKLAAEKRDADTVKRHQDAADMVALNQRHVILSYAAMWIIAAFFVIFLWRRQQGLKVELANLKRDLEAATKDAK